MKKPFAPLPLRAFALSLCILLLATALRFHLLCAQSLWNDEGNSYAQATRSFADIAANAARDIHPPGYYWLLALWRLFTGDSEFALRTLSAFASVLSVAFTIALGRRLFGNIVGIVAALLVALNTFSIYYAQEARMYSLLALWGAASMWVLVGFLTSPPAPLHTWRGEKARWALALGLLNVAGLWTQYAFPFVMLAQGVMAVLWVVGEVINSHPPTSSPLHGEGEKGALQVPRPEGEGFRVRVLLLYCIAANLLTLLLYLPWLPTAWGQLTTWPNTGDPAIPASDAIRVVFGWLYAGMTFQPSQWSALGWIPILLLVALIPASAYRRERVGWRALFPVMWTLLPVGLFLALGLFREGNVKLLLPAQIAFALWMARSVEVVWGLASHVRPPFPRVLRAVIALATAGLLLDSWAGLPLLYHDPGFRRDDYRGIVRDISADLRPGDAIVLDAPNQEEVFRYYYRGDAPVFPLPTGLGGNDQETRDFVYNQIIPRYDRVFALFWGDAERDPNHVVETTLDRLTFPIGANQWYGNVRLAVYSTPLIGFTIHPAPTRFGERITLEAYTLSPTTLRPGGIVQMALTWQTNATIATRYKVFVQLLNGEGVLVAQRDSEPGGDSWPTNAWQPGRAYDDLHGLVIPPDLPAGEYQLIAGLYNIDNPQERLPVGDSDYLLLSVITVME